MKRFLTTLFFILVAVCVGLYAQPINCPPGDVGENKTCNVACVNCKMNDGFSSATQKSFPANPPPYTIFNCQQGAPFEITNALWFAFIPSTPYLQLNIKITGCESGNGLEAAVTYACGNPPFEPVAALACATIDPGNPVFNIFNLIPGTVYYLVIDGQDGAVCKYDVSVAQGSANAPELGTLGPITGPTEVCPKAKVRYRVNPVQYATTYTWSAPPGSKINGGSNVKTIPVVAGQDVNGANEPEIEFGSQGGVVCVTANSQCDTSNKVCITVTNKAIPITNLADEVHCYEDLAYVWPEEPHTVLFSPGTYTLTSTPYQSYLGCDSVVRQKIKILPIKYKVLPPQYICEPDCYVLNGVEFCNSGDYLETIPSVDGCDSTIQFTVVKIPVKALAQVTDTLTCKKTEVLLTSHGSTKAPTIQYQWLNPSGQVVSTDSIAIATSPGVYSLIVTNNFGGKSCKDTATVVVIAQTTLPLSNAGPDMVLSCAQPQVQLQGSGSVGPQYSYLWIATNGGNITQGGATLTPTVNATGVYILRVTDNINGCTAVDVTKVTAQTLPPTAVAEGGTFTCTQPSVILQVTTNAVSPTFLWNGPNGFTSNLQNPAVNVAGDYTVIVTDSVTGCTNTAIAVVINGAQLPGATASGDTLTCVVNSVIINGNSPATNPTFAWTGPNGFTSTEQNPTVTNAGNYLLTVTGTNGCTSTATAVVTLNNTSPGASLAATGNLNCNNATINIVASSTPPVNLLTHLWTNPDGSTVSTGSNPVLNTGQPGVYNVVITNTQNGCTSSASVTVIQNPNVTAVTSAQLTSCNGSTDGSVSVTPGGGNGTYTYQWNTGANTATVNGLGAGTYTVTVTDGENCSATATATVSQPEPIAVNASATPQTANGAADGTATANPAGGTPGYTYIWNNGGNTATITDLLPGSYSVTVTDQNNCTAVAVVTVNAYNCTIAATTQSENVSCAGANDGSASIIVTNGVAPITYNWSNGGMTSTITDLAPGSYSGTATDAANCPTEVLVVITEPNPLLANASSTNATGPNTNDGTATAAPIGGTSPYTYLWTTGDLTASITGLDVGTYTVTVTDANDCTTTQSVTVAAGCVLTSNFIATNPTCNGLTNGQATVIITGGTSPFTYEWSSGGDEQTETNLGEGTYTVSVVDADGCETIDSVTLTEPDLLTVGVQSVTNTSCVNTPGGSATVAAQGGTGTISITWSNGQTGPTAINLVADDYTATATDANGCTATVSVTIDAVDTEAPSIVGNPVNVPLGPTGTITLTPQVLGVTVADNCAVSSVTVQPTTFNCTQLGPHTITLTATDDSGNTSTATVEATIIDNSPPTTTCPASIVRCFGDNVVQYDAPVATDNCLGNGGTWELTAGLPSGATFPVGVTTNTYTYTDAGGNPGSCSFEVNILSQIVVTADITDDLNNQGTGAIDLTVLGGLSPYTFVWTKNGQPFPATTEDLTGLGAGEYVVVVTDNFGCTIQSQIFTVKGIIGTNEPDWASGLLIMPNPTSGHVSVIFPDGVNEEVQLTVFDVTGRRVIQQNVTAPKQVDLDLSALPSGVYPVLLRIENEMIARRIVVSK